MDNETKNTMMNNINMIFSVIVFMKSYHWRTKVYSRHVASGEFVDSMEELLDKFVESYSGRLKRNESISDISINTTTNNSNDLVVLEILKSFSEQLSHIDIDRNWCDLITIRDEMLQLTNKTIYLFNMS